MTTFSRCCHLFIYISIIVLCNHSIFAQSSPPLLLNDPGTPGPGNWEINILSSFEHSAVSDEWEAIVFDINYGVGERIQLMVGLPYVVEWENSEKDLAGFNGMEFGIKYRFLDQESFGSDISVYPQISFPFKVGDIGREFSLPFQFHHEWSNFGLTAEIGHVWVKGESNMWEGGVGIAIFLHRVKLLGEWHTGVSESPFELAEPMMNVGLSWELSENFSLYFSVGKSLRSHEDQTNLWSLGGIQLLL